jgi:energy-coupling factor transporter transmembrane protein EcfT
MISFFIPHPFVLQIAPSLGVLWVIINTRIYLINFYDIFKHFVYL